MQHRPLADDSAKNRLAADATKIGPVKRREELVLSQEFVPARK
jgi:hypothetical protein